MTNTNSFGSFRNTGQAPTNIGRVESFEPSNPETLPGASIETSSITPTTSDPNTDSFVDGIGEFYDGAERGLFSVVDPRRWPME